MAINLQVIHFQPQPKQALSTGLMETATIMMEEQQYQPIQLHITGLVFHTP